MAVVAYVVRAPTEVVEIVDPHTQRTTRQLQVQQVGSTKHIRTYLLNIHDVADDCGDRASQIALFLGHELRLAVTVNDARPLKEQIFLGGEIDTDDLSDAFRHYLGAP